MIGPKIHYYPTLQPDGKIAVFAGNYATGNFVYFDQTPEEAASLILAYGYPGSGAEALHECELVERGYVTPFGPEGTSWYWFLGRAIASHGKNDEFVREAMRRTPDLTGIESYVAYYRSLDVERRIAR